MNLDNRTALEEALGYHFQRQGLLQLALSHSSYAREMQQAGSSSGTPSSDTAGGNADSPGDNEQLEFLGDSVLSFVISAELVRRFPQFREGTLSKLRASLVSEKSLADIARRFGIGEFLQLGRGEDKSGGREKATLLCDGLEAVLAAVYLDGGIDAARELILSRILNPELERLHVDGESWMVADYKSALQELIQANSRRHLSYTIVGEEGPEHRKSFTVEVRLLDAGSPEKAVFVRRAVGPTKKKAEQEAARLILEHMQAERLVVEGVEQDSAKVAE
jgi:ribonuclease III